MYSFKSKKGMKFNKLTHLTIVVVLAIVFIVVYLYYTIKDVKKIHNEVQKLTSHITEMNNSIANITSTIIPLLNTSQGQVSKDVPTGGQCGYVPNLQEQVNMVDDESSVNSQELKTIMETIEDEEKHVTTETEEYINDVANLEDIKDVEELVADEQETLKNASRTLDISNMNENVSDGVHEEDFKALPVDDLKKVSYEQLRKYCKNNGISFKGTKDVLIYRIKGITA